MKKGQNMSIYLKFMMYLAVVVLINLAGTTLFFRIDLTAGKAYSLSSASTKAVATLSEPLTVKAFFTEELPPPYNNIERYLRDLLEEYSVEGNRYFNYEFYTISSEQNEKSDRNKDLARGYGIYPVQIQNIDQDEVKFQKALMGLVMIQGDVIETIPTITSTDSLEYKIAVKMRKMNNKISALLNLKEKIDIKLFLSSSLQAVGPYMNLAALSELPGEIEKIVEKLNGKSYGRLAFQYLDPTQNDEFQQEADNSQVLSLRWEEFADRRGQTIRAGKGYAGLVVRYGDRKESIRLIRVMRIPIFGTQYQMMEPDQLESVLNEVVENVININEEIGYLTSHGCASLEGGANMPGQEQQGGLSNMNGLLSQDYSVRKINLKEETIPEGLSCLIIAGAKENFTDWELYQIDQYLMKGRSLALFLDRFNEMMPQQQNRMYQQNQGPVYLPLNTGLERLLGHSGISVRASYVLDENCFKQRMPQAYGGGQQSVYFAPIIKNENISKDVAFLNNIRGMVGLKLSPIDVKETSLTEEGLEAYRLFSSSDKAWEMEGRINLNPMFMRPPGPDEKRESMALAYLVEGRFPSYFAGKPIPEKPADDDKEAGSEGAGEGQEGVDMSKIASSGTTIEKGKAGKVFLVATSEMIKNNVIDKNGENPNAHFMMNVIDYLNNREDYAIMRTKTLRFNPLEEIEPGTKTLIKAFNIAGLPVIVVLAGLGVLFRRASRKRMIQNMFRQ